MSRGDTSSPGRVPPDGALTELVRARRLGSGAADALRDDLARTSRLGIGYLGVGSVIVGVILLGRGLISLGWSSSEAGGVQPLAVAAWAIVLLAFCILVVAARRARGTLSTWLFAAVLTADVLALAADAMALAISGSGYLSACIGVGATLVAAVTFRPVTEVFTVTVVLTAVGVLGVGALALTLPSEVATTVSQLMLTVVPPFAAVIVVRSFGSMVQRELDRTIAEGALAAPRYSLGLLASAELARLDLAAEELLQDVATGRIPLPLDRESSALAGRLATDLRRMLVAGRAESWLQHALRESEILGAVVTLVDEEGLAGYLSPSQRDGLLSAVWLVVDDSVRTTPTIDLEIGRPAAKTGVAPDDRMVLPMVVSIGGVSRRRIEPAVWSALSRVGQYSVESRSGSVRVRVDAHVVVPDPSR
ncbi:hypothetical protein N1031_01345 [Herbiconiux moechotypicola]|uniref:Uncharacterized protein n=1 Tax=Herbiconiux moechotypicola TaxID=637393 RepID=A0ABN3D890_9MICO|nr:hypothetical protein [Herbiconiux moechotypicola]MCS5728397.1 hypothetical protein [Herbiconiux moechotypicola]